LSYDLGKMNYKLYFICDDIKPAHLVRAQECESWGHWFDFGKTPNPRESKLLTVRYKLHNTNYIRKNVHLLIWNKYHNDWTGLYSSPFAHRFLRLVLNFYHINDPEPKVNCFVAMKTMSLSHRYSLVYPPVEHSSFIDSARRIVNCTQVGGSNPQKERKSTITGNAPFKKLLQR